MPNRTTIQAQEAAAAQAFITKRLTMRHLWIIKTLYEAGSITDAAETLHVTQPAISKAIGEIEAGLGQILFLRKDRSLQPTPCGSHLLALAEQVLGSVDRAGRQVAALTSGSSGTVSIGATNVVMSTLLPCAIRASKQASPAVSIQVQTRPLVPMFDDLRRGRLDLLVGRFPSSGQPTDLESTPLLSSRDVVVASVDHPLVRKPGLSLADLIDEQWIWPRQGTSAHRMLDDYLHGLGLAAPSRVIESGDLMFNTQMLRLMPLLVLMPLQVARPIVAQGEAVMLPVQMDLGFGDITLWHQRGRLLPPVEAFKQHLLATAAALAKRDSSE